MSSMIQLDNLVFSWPRQKTPVLSIPHWQVERGERVFLHGPSGGGKSTLLNLLAGLLLPQQGRVKILQTELQRLSGRARDRFRAQHIGLVFQQFNLIPYLDVETNILLGAHFNPARRAACLSPAALLERLALPATLLHQPASQLSVGQQQRVAVARALINAPALIIADEPTSALDSDTRDAFIRLLLDCAGAQNSTLIFVSHDRTLAPYFTRHEQLAQLNQATPVQESTHAV